MSEITVWTRQHKTVAEKIEKNGRFVADPVYAAADFGEERNILLECYRWLAGNCPTADKRPADAVFPVWISLTRETIQPPQKDFVIMELSIDETFVDRINIAKWGAVLNFSYIPSDEEDRRRHGKEMREIGISDTEAFLSRFYPQIKADITASWKRLFDPSVDLGGDLCYGITWELRKEWIRRMTGE